MRATIKLMKADYGFALVMLVILMPAFKASAQSAGNVRTATIRWQIAEVMDERTAGTRQESFELTTSPTEIVLKQGQQARKFMIISTSGTWTDPQQNGTLEFQLAYGNKTGKGRLERGNNRLVFKIDFSDYPGGMKQTFVINQYQIQ